MYKYKTSFQVDEQIFIFAHDMIFLYTFIIISHLLCITCTRFVTFVPFGFGVNKLGYPSKIVSHSPLSHDCIARCTILVYQRHNYDLTF